MLSLFEVSGFDRLSEKLKTREREGLNENKVHNFLYQNEHGGSDDLLALAVATCKRSFTGLAEFPLIHNLLPFPCQTAPRRRWCLGPLLNADTSG